MFGIKVFISLLVGTTWSTDSSSRSTSWLVLRNLTPQVFLWLLLCSLTYNFSMISIIISRCLQCYKSALSVM